MQVHFVRVLFFSIFGWAPAAFLQERRDVSSHESKRKQEESIIFSMEEQEITRKEAIEFRNWGVLISLNLREDLTFVILYVSMR